MAQTKPFRPSPPGHSNCFGSYQCVILSSTFHRVRADQISPSTASALSFPPLKFYHGVTACSDLRKALLWTWRRRSRHTRSTPRTRDRNRTGDTRTVRRNTRPGRCTSPHHHVPCQTHKLTLNCVCVPCMKHSMTLVLTCSHWLGLGPLCTHTSAPQSPDHTHRFRTPAPRALGCSGCCSPRGFDGSHTRTGTPVRSPGYLGNPPAASKTAVGQQDSLLTRP